MRLNSLKGFLLICLFLGKNFLFAQAQVSWQQVGAGLPNLVQSAAVYNDKLYAVTVQNVDKATLHEWDGNTWKDITVFNAHHILIYKLVVYKDELYAAGYFSSINGEPYTKSIARWDGTTWRNVAKGLEFAIMPLINDMLVYKDKLYITGTFSIVDTITTNGIAYWDGESWHKCGEGLRDVNLNRGSGYTLAVHQDTLYVGGTFEWAGDSAVKNVAKWDGNQWYPVGNGLFNPVGYTSIDKLISYNDKLLAIGNFAVDSVSNYAYWQNNTWQSWEKYPKQGTITSGAVYENVLYLGGNNLKLSQDTTTYRVLLSNYAIDTLQTHLNLNGNVNCWVSYQNEWYALGDFTTSDTDSINRVAVLRTNIPTSNLSKPSTYARPIIWYYDQQLFIDSQIALQYELYNSTGQIVQAGTYLPNEKFINTYSLANGVYICKLKNESFGVISFRFIQSQ